MGFSSRPTADLIQIVSYGGGLIMDAGSRPLNDLVQIASYAAAKGNKVTMLGMQSRPTNDLIQIASYGKGNVIFG